MEEKSMDFSFPSHLAKDVPTEILQLLSEQVAKLQPDRIAPVDLMLKLRAMIMDSEARKLILQALPYFGLYAFRDFTSAGSRQIPILFSLAQRSQWSVFAELLHAMEPCAESDYVVEEVSKTLTKADDVLKWHTLITYGMNHLISQSSIPQWVAEWGYTHGSMSDDQRAVKDMLLGRIVDAELTHSLLRMYVPKCIQKLIAEFLPLSKIKFKDLKQHHYRKRRWRECFLIDVVERRKEALRNIGLIAL
jgi:hypothetical protein